MTVVSVFSTVTGATQTKLTNQITGKEQNIPGKLTVGQSAARKKTMAVFTLGC